MAHDQVNESEMIKENIPWRQESTELLSLFSWRFWDDNDVEDEVQVRRANSTRKLAKWDQVFGIFSPQEYPADRFCRERM